MIIYRKSDDPQIYDLVRKYTVENKNLAREERIAGRQLPRKRWIKLYHQQKEHFFFPPGQFSDILQPWPKLEVPLVYDTTVKDDNNLQMHDMIDEQNEILTRIEFSNMRTWLIEMKTGRGKSIAIMRIVKHFQEPTLIVVHNKKTVQEMMEKFQKFCNRKIGCYYSTKKDMQEITVTTHKTFVLNTELFRNKFGLIICDEIDTNLSDKMITAISTVGCTALFGLSWTPFRQQLDTNDISLIFWPHLKVESLAQNWYTLIPEIIRIEFPSIVCSFETFHELRQDIIADVQRRHMQCEYITSFKTLMSCWLLLVGTVEECNLYYEWLKDKMPCAIVNGTTKIDDDIVNIDKMKTEHGVIIATAQKMYRGVDIPEIDHVFLFYPTRFEGNIIQAVGRWLRQCAGKLRTVLHDWSDIPLLRWQSYQRKAAYQKEYPWVKIDTISLPRSFTENEDLR